MAPNVFQVAGVQAVNRQIYHTFSKLNLPRHTSYPAVPYWDHSFDSSAFSSKLSEIAQESAASSFYLHVPFCERLCHYCGCNKLVVSRQNDEADGYAKRYLDAISKEVQWVNLHANGRLWNVKQIHWGGGTPTWLGLQEIEQVWTILTSNMSIHPDAEISIELDPRVTSFEQLRLLKQLGFNRVSLGVQDFDEQVQKAIQRTQPEELVQNFVDECRKIGFKSINFDLIYGLPHQSVASMERTLASVIRMAPERIAFYRLALLPDIFKWQRTFKATDIPGDDQILDIILLAMKRFTENGWYFIGLDHFAKETDELAIAYKNGSMRRSFQGMTTGDELPVIGIGPSAISSLGGVFAQNEVQFPKWSKLVSENGHATIKGMILSQDDLQRQWALNQLYCYRYIDKIQFLEKFGAHFDEYFSRSFGAWRELTGLGLIENSNQFLRVRPMTGWLLLRVVASTLDAYLNPDAWRIGVTNGIGSRVG